MDQKSPVGLRIFGWIEIAIGVMGTLVLIDWLFFFVYCLLRPAETEIGGAIAFMFVFCFLPAPLFLLAGIGTIALKSWGRKINVIGIPVLVSVLAAVALIFHLRGLMYAMTHEESKEWRFGYTLFILLDIFVASVLIFPVLWFFNLQKVRDQFK